MVTKRQKLFTQIWDSQDEAYDLMFEYDSLPHNYGDAVLYQAEAYIINLIGQHPGITSTELAHVLKKTTSACSQIVRKLRSKNWVEQIRNEKNNRIYNLHLTESGLKLYEAHRDFNLQCQEITFSNLSEFSDDQLAVYLQIQRKLNEIYQADVQRSKEFLK